MSTIMITALMLNALAQIIGHDKADKMSDSKKSDYIHTLLAPYSKDGKNAKPLSEFDSQKYQYLRLVYSKKVTDRVSLKFKDMGVYYSRHITNKSDMLKDIQAENKCFTVNGILANDACKKFHTTFNSLLENHMAVEKKTSENRAIAQAILQAESDERKLEKIQSRTNLRNKVTVTK